jgi:hypothetical protein
MNDMLPLIAVVLNALLIGALAYVLHLVFERREKPPTVDTRDLREAHEHLLKLEELLRIKGESHEKPIAHV